MSLILHIDTALDIANLSIALDGEILGEVSNTEQKEHGRFLHPSLQSLLVKTAISIHDLDAVAISAGPGSYTGLRIGMASAKGLCYALNKPLITISTLEILAFSAILETSEKLLSSLPLFCPMIDARRMEVYTAVYDQKLNPLSNPAAIFLDENFCAKLLLNNKLLFLGNGAKKWAEICNLNNADFIEIGSNTLSMSKLAHKKYEIGDFANLFYSQPFYLKEFFSPFAK